MDQVRPYLAYALGISWNVEFYQVNTDPINRQGTLQKGLEVDVLKDEKYKISSVH